MKRIGIMGGTFNPIHNGHLTLANQAYFQYHLDEVIFLPTGNPPHKDNIMVCGEKRKHMVELAIADYPYFSCSDLEIRQKRTSYTANSLTYLCSRHPDCKFYYIVGADSLNYMEEWYHPKTIFQKAVILVAMRDTEPLKKVSRQKEFLEQKYQAEIYFLSCPEIKISSSEIREEIKKGNRITQKIPPSVMEYICKRQLYR